MAESLVKIKSLSQLHEVSGFGKPTYPLISIINTSDIEVTKEHIGTRSSMDLYAIGLKDKSCSSLYGRKSYDFNEGLLFFTAPNQVQTIISEQKKGEVQGWMIVFHPDLIRNTQLGKNIDNYNFFSYSVNEALHLSESEQNSIEDCKNLIEKEIAERTDNHSQSVISSSLELLLNLSNRFYERQFNTRSAENNDLSNKFESLLKSYFKEGMFKELGVPSLEYFSEKMRLSPSYLSDLLKKQTGSSATDYVNSFLIEKAKTMLLSTDETVSGIAYDLGFNYPHYFSRLFKRKTGISPKDYRLLN